MDIPGKLYIFDHMQDLNDGFLEQSLPYLSRIRRDKVERCQFLCSKIQSSAAFLLLRLALAEECGIRHSVDFRFGPQGKPYICGHPGIFFSISHCREAVVCALSSGEIGADVQEFRPVSRSLPRRILTPEELRDYEKSPDKTKSLFRHWVTKEAYLKQTGHGITRDLSALSAAKIPYTWIFDDNGSYTACVSGNPVRPDRRYVQSMDEIFSQIDPINSSPS